MKSEENETRNKSEVNSDSIGVGDTGTGETGQQQPQQRPATSDRTGSSPASGRTDEVSSERLGVE